jgi:glycine/D-amino acid oxidase-like deaminating enzyme
MPAEVDVAVVGAGVIGLAAARELGRRGASVVVLERTGVGAGQSGVQQGGVRRQFGTEIGCRLASESVAFWREAETQLGSAPLRFDACGYLFVAHSPETLERLRRNVAVQNAAGVPSRIVDPAEAAELVPGLSVETLTGGAWCAEDGYFDRPQEVVTAFGRGADVRIGEVTALHPAGDGWEVDTATGPVRAAAVVVAIGAESRELLAPLGVDVPLDREERHLFLSLPLDERLLEPLVVSPERSFAAKQLGDGRVLASDLGAKGDVEKGASRWRARIRSGISELLPVLEQVDFPTISSGVYDITPDRQPILGPLPGLDGVQLAAGFSGHGFMLAPAVARILADAVEGRRDPALDVLDLARFEEARPVPEPQVV